MGLKSGLVQLGLFSGGAIAGAVWGLLSGVVQVVLTLFSFGACRVPPTTCPAYLKLLWLPTQSPLYQLLVLPSTLYDWLFSPVFDNVVDFILFITGSMLTGLLIGLFVPWAILFIIGIPRIVSKETRRIK